MPELPEVETIRQYLRRGHLDQPPILGQRIRAARLLWERTLTTPSPAVFEPRLVGQTINEVGRRGKYLILFLSSDALLFHLRMSGDLMVEPVETPLAPHHRLVLEFDSGIRLAFNDTRKFGRAWLVADHQEVFASLGPEPFDPALTPQVFHQLLQSRHRQLKPLLLDQTFIAGMGNIYTDEALHLARLHPLTLSASLSAEQSEKLLGAIRDVLAEGIRQHGASIDWVYRGGDFQNYFRAYQRTGQPCPNCGTPIERLLVGQRSTHVCPNCQPRI